MMVLAQFYFSHNAHCPCVPRLLSDWTSLYFDIVTCRQS